MCLEEFPVMKTAHFRETGFKDHIQQLGVTSLVLRAEFCLHYSKEELLTVHQLNDRDEAS